MTYKAKTFAGAARIFAASLGRLGLAVLRSLRPDPIPDDIRRRMDKWDGTR